jgi:hypothetical protein
MMKIEMLLFLKNLLNSWILNETTCRWEAPIAKPNDDGIYTWNETIQTGNKNNHF